ncbi:ImmA/IrrE family metallo-endopeptidase [Polaromonas sp. P1(28)-13]|nr:ImmA/IrrE family metallo-endopeptidase [Polaromonas sp. P1(28)-13]
MFEPRVVAGILGLEYELRDSIGAIDSRNAEAAGVLNRRRETISISTKFEYEIQRFTAAHEIGHYVLHPRIGYEIEHRDRPIFGMAGGRPQHEADADYFAACMLVPCNALIAEFEARFGTKKPLPYTTTTAYHVGLTIKDFETSRDRLMFAKAVARTQSFDRLRFLSLADFFKVSVSALAIRLWECGLIDE